MNKKICAMLVCSAIALSEVSAMKSQMSTSANSANEREDEGNYLNDGISLAKNFIEEFSEINRVHNTFNNLPAKEKIKFIIGLICGLNQLDYEKLFKKIPGETSSIMETTKYEDWGMTSIKGNVYKVRDHSVHAYSSLRPNLSYDAGIKYLKDAKKLKFWVKIVKGFGFGYRGGYDTLYFEGETKDNSCELDLSEIGKPPKKDDEYVALWEVNE